MVCAHAQCGVYNVHAHGDNLVFVHLVSFIIQRPSHKRYIHYMVAAVGWLVYGYSLPPRSTFRSPTRGPSGNEGLNSFVSCPVSLRKSKSVHCSTVSVKTRRNDSPQPTSRPTIASNTTRFYLRSTTFSRYGRTCFSNKPALTDETSYQRSQWSNSSLHFTVSQTAASTVPSKRK